VKSSGGDEPMWFAIHKYIEATLGISLYNYLYLTKKLYVFLISYVFSSTKSEKRAGYAWKLGWGMGEVALTMYTHVSKCKNDKNK
jgi:hypothetical protein